MPNRSLTRACTLAVGAVAVCLVSSGTAFADTLPLPVPSPGDVLSSTQQTVAGLLPNPTTTPTLGSTTLGSTTPPAATPPTTVPQQATATDSPKTTTVTTARHAAAPRVAHHGAQRGAPAASTTASAYAGSFTVVPAALRLPPSTEVSDASGVAPAVAPLLVGSPTRHAVTAAGSTPLDRSSDAVLRGLLLTVALTAAVALGAGHLWQLGRRVG